MDEHNLGGPVDLESLRAGPETSVPQPSDALWMHRRNMDEVK
jgi:hypothetical protein